MAGCIIIAGAAVFQEKQCSTGLGSGERVDWIAHEGRGTTFCCGMVPLDEISLTIAPYRGFITQFLKDAWTQYTTHIHDFYGLT